MKSLILIGIGLISLNASALEFSAKSPLFTKNQTPGFAPPQYQLSEKCEVYRYKVVKTKGVGSLKSTEQKSVKLEGPALKLLADVLAADQVTTPGPSDVPATTYSFSYVEENTTKSYVFSKKGFSNIETQGSSAQLLKNFIDKICR